MKVLVEDIENASKIYDKLKDRIVRVTAFVKYKGVSFEVVSTENPGIDHGISYEWRVRRMSRKMACVLTLHTPTGRHVIWDEALGQPGTKDMPRVAKQLQLLLDGYMKEVATAELDATDFLSVV